MNTTLVIILFVIIIAALAFLIFLLSKKGLGSNKSELGALMERLDRKSVV